MELKNTFYRPLCPNDLESRIICEKFEIDLEILQSGQTTACQVKDYLSSLIEQGEETSSAFLWNLIDINKICEDSIVEYLLRPTALAITILANAKLIYPDLTNNINNYDNVLKKGLDILVEGRAPLINRIANKYYLDSMAFFAKSSIPFFLKIYPEISHKFCKRFETFKECARSFAPAKGIKASASKNSMDFKFSKILELINESEKGTFSGKTLFTYGTLMKGNSNHFFMDKSRYIGEAYINDFAIYDLGSYPAIKPFVGKKVKGELYSVTTGDFERIRQLEGDGFLYNSQLVNAKYNSKTIKSFTFVYLRHLDKNDEISGDSHWGRFHVK